MAGLDPAIRTSSVPRQMAGSGPAMTIGAVCANPARVDCSAAWYKTRQQVGLAFPGPSERLGSVFFITKVAKIVTVTKQALLIPARWAGAAPRNARRYGGHGSFSPAS
jgi:hypothetical protein